MKLTKREKNMLIVLVGLVSIYGYMHFIISPQILNIKDLKGTIKDYELIINNENYSEDTLINLNGEYEKQLKNVEGYSNGYFISLEQSTLILLIDNFIKNTDLEILGVDFSEYRTEQVGSSELNVISASIPFRGYYESLLDFLNEIRHNDKKILVRDINISKDDVGQVYGNVVLDFYSIPPIGSKKLSSGIVNEPLSSKLNPFAPFEGYIDEVLGYLDNSEINTETNYNQSISAPSNNDNKPVETTKKTILEGFETLDMFFVGNPRDVEGSVAIDTNRKQGNFSIKLQYDFLVQRENNVANAVFDVVKPTISMQPEYISISIYAYERSNHKLGLILKDALGKEHDILLASNVDWVEWNTFEATLPSEITYPAQVQRIYVQSDDMESKINGVFLLDNMEVAYRDTLPHSYDSTVNSNEYIEYYVKQGDTIFNISKRFYNDYSKRFIIMERNNIKDPNEIKIGQKLLIPKI